MLAKSATNVIFSAEILRESGFLSWSSFMSSQIYGGGALGPRTGGTYDLPLYTTSSFHRTTPESSLYSDSNDYYFSYRKKEKRRHQAAVDNRSPALLWVIIIETGIRWRFGCTGATFLCHSAPL